MTIELLTFYFADANSFFFFLLLPLSSSLESDGSKESLNLHLVQLLNEAEKQLEEKSQPPSSSPVRIDLDKHVALWKRRVRILRKMKSGLEQLSESKHQFCLVTYFLFRCLRIVSEVPNSPNQARVEAVGEHSVHIWWLQPEADSGGICTKFKGEFDKRAKHVSVLLLDVELFFPPLTGSLSLSTIFTVKFLFFSFLFKQSNGQHIRIFRFRVVNWRCAIHRSGSEAEVLTNITR